MFSAIFLPLTKAIWFGLMSSPKKLLSLFAKNFVLHLYRTLQQAIGLNSTAEDGLGTLGTMVIIVELISF